MNILQRLSGTSEKKDLNEEEERLFEAAGIGDLVTIELLLQEKESPSKSINVNCCDSNDKTPLHKAAWSGQTEAIELLVKMGAEVDKSNGNGGTPLHNAAWNGHTAAIELLMKMGAEVDKSDGDGRTPLHIAAENGHTEAVELLLKMGAKE